MFESELCMISKLILLPTGQIPDSEKVDYQLKSAVKKYFIIG